MIQTLAFLAACAAVLSTPFLWRWRRKRKCERLKFEASAESMWSDIEAFFPTERNDR